jgi:type I restriction enzyme S subunit
MALPDVLDFREGPGIMAADFHEAGVPLIRLAGLKPGAHILDGCNYLDPEKVATKWSHFCVEAGDVLLSTSASLGEVAVVREAGVGAVPYTGIIRFRPRNGSIAAEFIQYALRGPDFKRQIVEIGVGSVMNHFGPSHLKHMRLLLPPVTQQRAIAEVLGAIDDKIAANTSRTKTAAALIDAQFLVTVSGVPRGLALGSLVSVTKGVSYRRSDLDDKSQTAMVTLKSVTRDGEYAATGLRGFTGIVKDAQMIQPGEVVVAQTDLTQAAEVVGRAVRVPSSSAHDSLVASLDLAIVRPRGSMPTEYLAGLLRTSEFRQHCRDRTSGTTVLHLGRGAIESFKAPAVPEPVQFAYARFARPLFDLVNSVHAESAHLAATRDALLPGLVSGRIRVKDAEKVVEGVV